MIRFDMKFALLTPVDCPREVWFDHAIVQETCPTHAEKTLNYLEAKETNLPAGSPPFQKMHKSKEQREETSYQSESCRYCPLHLERQELGSLHGVLQVSLSALVHAELP